MLTYGITINQITVIAGLCLIIAFFFYFYSAYKFVTQESKQSLLDYSKTTILPVVQKMPSKWFDWIKYIFIIGVFSIIKENTHDLYLSVIISISYLAILIDTYIFVHGLYFDTIFTPVDIRITQLESIYAEASNVLNERERINNEIERTKIKLDECKKIAKKNDDTLNAKRRQLDQRKYLHIGADKEQKILQEFIEDIDLKSKRNNENIHDLEVNIDNLSESIKAMFHYNELKSMLDKAKGSTISIKKMLRILGFFTALFITFYIYGLINYLIPLYLLYHLDKSVS